MPPLSPLTLDRCSINTATLGHRSSIEQVIEAVARHGFGAIAPWRRDLVDRDVPAVARRIREAGLAVSGLCRSTYFPAATRAEFLANVEDNRRALDVAAALGAPCFVLVVGTAPADHKGLGPARAQVLEGLSLLLDHARSVGVSLAIEPLHPMYAGDRSCVASLSEALAMCDALDTDGRGGVTVAIDAYHVWWDWRLSEDIAAAGHAGRIAAFHVCDWLVPTRDLLLDRGMMGEGVIDLPAMRAAIEAAGYRGFVEVEIFSNHWWSQPEEAVLDACGRSFRQI
ncbi:sugar phosphate isomerase/epimerase family protein [Methylobacterium aquaticum]|uniref:sugar phosphate isomerase/epimerase family protein n=1 Tax=Methylobacterium aquaticum TaxID=270351 RepID=UPI003D170FAC